VKSSRHRLVAIVPLFSMVAPVPSRGVTAPYVPSPEHAEVLVTVDGQQWPGLVIGWRGDRVDVIWKTGVGMTHVGFVDACQVQRVEPELSR